MQRWLLYAVIASLVLLGVVSVAAPRPMLSPGALVAGHAALEGDCFACHTAFQGADATQCVGCHKMPDIGLRTTKGVAITHARPKPAFHQAMGGQDCVACHTDHALPKFAGAPHPRFAHALLPATTAAQCASCHTAPTSAMHRAPLAQCSTCHATGSWAASAINHDRYFVLDRHHNVACATCHTAATQTTYTCYGCHEHQKDRTVAKHVREGVRGDITNCVACHRSASDKPEREGRDRRKHD